METDANIALHEPCPVLPVYLVVYLAVVLAIDLKLLIILQILSENRTDPSKHGVSVRTTGIIQLLLVILCNIPYSSPYIDILNEEYQI